MSERPFDFGRESYLETSLARRDLLLPGPLASSTSYRPDEYVHRRSRSCLQPVGSPLSKGSTALPKIPKNMMVKVPGSGVSSRTASPVSVKSTSPRRSYEVAAEESKQIKDSFNQDIAGLKEQVEQLTSKTHQLEEELEKTRKQLKVVTAMAADEAEENRSAKEVIRSLTTQLKEMAEKQSQKDGISTNSRRRDKETSETLTQTSSQIHIRSMVSHDDQTENNLTSRSFVKGHRKQNEKPERVVQDEPGVYLTLLSLPGGGHELKRVRFSRKQFTEEQAEKWWGENGTKVCERHNILVS